MKKFKGFTILELLVALVIMGIVLSLAVMAINRYVIFGHNTIDKQLEKQLELSTKNYLNDNKSTLKVDDSLIVWYTTLKSNNYMTNDLIDSNGNSCGKSYVVVKKELGKNEYNYSTCITCDNGGYSNISSKKECTSNFASSLNCTFTRKDDKKVLGVNTNNTDELSLVCRGNSSVGFSNNASSLESVFTISNGEIVSIDDDSIIKNDKKSSINATIKVRTINSNALTIVFNGDSSSSKLGFTDKKTNVWTNHAAIPITIPVDGVGPKCSLSGPYKDSSYKEQVKAVKSGSKVYYRLVCNDDNGIKTKSLTKDNFVINDVVSDVKINVDNNNKSLTGDIEVVISNNHSSKELNLAINSNSILDEFDNGNEMIYSMVENENSVLVIDDQAPGCSFSGPSSDINIKYSKTKMNIALSPTDYVYYSLKCDDENDIVNNFSINNITNNGFSKIELAKTNDVTYGSTHRGYEYIIKAYSTKSEGTGYLTYNVNNTIDKVGNAGVNNVISSNKAKMLDYTKIPKCDISTSYASDYRSATLTGNMIDEKGLSGYAWSNDYGEPSRYYTTSGTSNSVSNTITSNGYYYLHMKNVNDLTGYCLVYITSIKEAPPETPVLEASDEISSGDWHNSNFTLTASGSGSNVTYYYGTSSYSLPYTSPISVSSETSGTTYYAKACSTKDHTNCSDVARYNALLDKTKPTCTLSGTKSNGDSYSAGYWTMYNVTMNLSSSDSMSGINTSKTSLVNPFNNRSYTSGSFTTSVSNGRLGVGTVTATCTDIAGNTSNANSFSLKIDKEDPKVSLSPAGKKLTGETKITLECSDGSGSGVESKSMTSPSGSTYSQHFTISKSGGTVKATCKDVVGNKSEISETYTPPCTWSSWSNPTTTYSTSCTPSSTDTKKVTCTSGYKEKIKYTGKATYSYAFSSTKSIIVKGTGASKSHCATKLDFIDSCRKSTDVGKYKFVSAAKKSGDTRCDVKECVKKISGYANYTAGKPTYSKTCTATGAKGRSETYTICTSGYYKIETSTRSCR